MRVPDGSRAVFVDAGGGVLHALVHEPPEADTTRPSVVLLHSLGTDGRIWHDVGTRLGARRRGIVPDLRGHGLSAPGRPPHDLAAQAADVLALLDELDVRRAALVGVSLGGLVAQRIALDHPARVSALVLACTDSRIGDATRYAARMAAVREGGIEAIADAQLARWFGAGVARARPATVAGVRRMLVGQSVEGYLAGCSTLRDADVGGEIARLRVPTLCIAGERDGSTPPATLEALAARIPGATCETMAGVGHLPCIERPVELAARLDAFLDASDRSE